ncbi:MAG TPA: LysR substrate-binding domain-containing protein [Dongiaceae bacterium]
MTPRLPALAALRAFEAIARTGSVRKAALELHVTPGAVSQQLKALETDLGIELVRRQGNALVLTQAALKGREDLIEGFRLITEATARIRRHRLSDQLRLSVDPALAAHWLIARLPAYRALPGSVDVLLDANKAFADLESGQADIAIRFGTGDFPRLAAHALFEDEIFPVCAPCVLHSGGGLKEPTDLRNHTLLHLEWSSRFGIFPDWRAWLNTAEAREVDAEKGLRFTDDTVILRAAVEGQGVALGNRTLVKDLIKDGRLVAPFARPLKTGFTYYVVYPKASEARLEIIGLRDWLLAEAAAD